MNPDWQRCGLIPPGGTVFDLASCSPSSLWAASPVGLFARKRGHWRPVTRGFPYAGTSAILATKNTVFVAGLPHGLVRSPDQGYTWHLCWTEQTENPITCLVPSPNFNRDGVMFAGTDGDGILRSTDGGRFLRLANFGMRNFSILSMVVAPVWGRRELVFAGTEAGFYQSPNGGRAWRQIGDVLQDKKILTLLVSPNFAEDHTIFAGTESHGLFQSKDGGWSWLPFPLAPTNPHNINCLGLNSQGGLLIGTGTQGILLASMDGSSNKVVAPSTPPVLCFGQMEASLFAGVSDNGLLNSNDDGETWTSYLDLAARRFGGLSITTDNTCLAVGATEGVWVSPDGGISWERTATGYEDAVPLDLATYRNTFVVGTSEGVLVSRDGGGHWAQTLDSEIPITAVALAEDRIWVGDGSGQIFKSHDEGISWQLVDTPFEHLSVVDIKVSIQFSEDQTLVITLMDAKRKLLQIWRSTDAGNQWHLWVDEKTNWSAARLSLQGYQAQEMVLGIGTTVLMRHEEGWQRKEITTADAPIASLLTTSDPPQILVATADEVLISADGETWESFSHGLESASIIALERSPDFATDHTIWGLTMEGEIWKRALPKS